MPYCSLVVVARSDFYTIETGDGIEMSTNYGNAPRHDNPMGILNECRDTDRAIDSIHQNLERLQYLQQQSIDDPDASQNTAVNRELDSLNTDTMTLYRNLANRVNKIKKMDGAGHENNAAQVRRVDNKLKDAIQKYQKLDAEFRKRLQAQMARQYRIVRPDASESEVREACEDTSGGQVFSQAVSNVPCLYTNTADIFISFCKVIVAANRSQLSEPFKAGTRPSRRSRSKSWNWRNFSNRSTSLL